jgi:hypothetical protein
MTKDRKKTGGRKKGVQNKATLEIKEIIDKAVNFNEVIAKLFELTQGVEVFKDTASGGIVYSEKPDSFAAKILLEYRFGKPLQTLQQNTTITSPQSFKIGDQIITFE